MRRLIRFFLGHDWRRETGQWGDRILGCVSWCERCKKIRMTLGHIKTGKIEHLKA